MDSNHPPADPSSLQLSSYPSSYISYSSSPTIKKQKNSITSFTSTYNTIPDTPAAWTWTCHQCYQTYPLSATRRCLHDGHRFCAGVTSDRRFGKLRKHKACGSTFDYAGWKTYNTWREETLASRSIAASPTSQIFRPSSISIQGGGLGDLYLDKETSPVSSPASAQKNCEKDCNFPSECRWNPPPLRAAVKKAKRSHTIDKLRGQIQQSKGDSTAQLNLKSAKPSSPENTLSPVSPLSPSPTKTSHTIQPLADVDYRAPVLDFAAFKARLDKAAAGRTLETQGQRNRGRQEQSRSSRRKRQDLQLELPELQFGGPLLMDVDAISPRDELPENKGIQVAIPIREGPVGQTCVERDFSSDGDRGRPDPNSSDHSGSNDLPIPEGSNSFLLFPVPESCAIGSGEQEAASRSSGTKRESIDVILDTAAWDWSMGGDSWEDHGNGSGGSY